MADHQYYSDIDDVRADLLDAVSETDLSDAVMERAALDAYDEINARLGKRYTVPFELSSTGNTPGIVRKVSDFMIACWCGHHTHGLTIRPQGGTKAYCDKAEALLEGLESGTYAIQGVTSSALPDSSTRGEHPVFAPISEHEWGQDSDQADRIEDERD